MSECTFITVIDFSNCYSYKRQSFVNKSSVEFNMNSDCISE